MLPGHTPHLVPALTCESQYLNNRTDGRPIYETNDGGEYYQVYTRTLEGGFFFEIVERRNYKGFGAVNAAIRLAAQTRLARHAARLTRR